MAVELFWLAVLSLVVACVSWTVTHEELLREPREWAAQRSRSARRWWQRKFFYTWTCEYCFSHYVSAAAIAVTGFALLLDDWRGCAIAWLAVTAVANVYLSAYSRLRVDIHREKAELQHVERHNGSPRDEEHTARSEDRINPVPRGE